jgi:signal transduction histidine kinase
VPGRGLVNMRERARLEGGELEARPVDGGFRVHAVLPAGTAVPE